MPSSGFCCSCRPPSENKRREKYGQIVGPWQRSKKSKLWNIRATGIPIVVCGLGMVLKDWRKRKSEGESSPFRLHHCWDQLECARGLLSLILQWKTTNKHRFESPWNSSQEPGKETRWSGDLTKNWNPQDLTIIKIMSMETWWDLLPLRLQWKTLELLWKNCKSKIIMINYFYRMIIIE